MYVDFTLKSNVDKANAAASKKASSNLQPKMSAVKTTYYINDKNDNCFCEFESIKSTSGSYKKIINGGKSEQHGSEITFANAIEKRNKNKDSVVYIAPAW